MPLKTKLAVVKSGLLPTTMNLIVRGWKPVGCGSLTEYRESLAELLRSEVPSNASVDTEYERAGSVWDVHVHWRKIVFKDELFLAISYNIGDRKELDALVARILSLETPERHSIVVFCGAETKREFVDHFHQTFPEVSVVVKL